MTVDVISLRSAEHDMPMIHARIEDALGRMEPLADETGQPVNFAPTRAEVESAKYSSTWGDLDRRVTANVERAQRAMMRCREIYPVP